MFNPSTLLSSAGLRSHWSLGAVLALGLLGGSIGHTLEAAPAQVSPVGTQAKGKSHKAGALQDPAQPGPFTVRSQEFLKDRDNVQTDFDLYMPTTAGVYPAVVLGHGFSQYKDYQHDNAMQLASWGFVVLVPTFSSFADHAQNAYEMLDLLDWLTGVTNPYGGMVDPDRLGLAGHSAGGLSTTIAAGLDAQTDGRVGAVMGMDPVDVVQGQTSEGIPFAKTIAAPTFYLTGIPYGCNSNGNSQGMWDVIPPTTDKMFLRIASSMHCDFNDQDIDHACTPGMHPARPLKVARLLLTQGWAPAYDAATAGTCAIDGATVDRSMEVGFIREYLTAWFLSNLADQTWADAWLYDGAEVTKDVQSGKLVNLQY